MPLRKQRLELLFREEPPPGYARHVAIPTEEPWRGSADHFEPHKRESRTQRRPYTLEEKRYPFAIREVEEVAYKVEPYV